MFMKDDTRYRGYTCTLTFSELLYPLCPGVFGLRKYIQWPFIINDLWKNPQRSKTAIFSIFYLFSSSLVLQNRCCKCGKSLFKRVNGNSTHEPTKCYFAFSLIKTCSARTFTIYGNFGTKSPQLICVRGSFTS